MKFSSHSGAVSCLVSQLDPGRILREIQTLMGGCCLIKGKVEVGNSTEPFPPVPGALFHTTWDQPLLSRAHSSPGTQMMAGIIPLKCKGRQWKKNTLKTSAVNFSGKLPHGADWVKLDSDLTCVFH